MVGEQVAEYDNVPIVFPKSYNFCFQFQNFAPPGDGSLKGGIAGLAGSPGVDNSNVQLTPSAEFAAESYAQQVLSRNVHAHSAKRMTIAIRDAMAEQFEIDVFAGKRSVKNAPAAIKNHFYYGQVGDQRPLSTRVAAGLLDYFARQYEYETIHSMSAKDTPLTARVPAKIRRLFAQAYSKQLAHGGNIINIEETPISASGVYAIEETQDSNPYEPFEADKRIDGADSRENRHCASFQGRLEKDHNASFGIAAGYVGTAPKGNVSTMTQGGSFNGPMAEHNASFGNYGGRVAGGPSAPTTRKGKARGHKYAWQNGEDILHQNVNTANVNTANSFNNFKDAYGSVRTAAGSMAHNQASPVKIQGNASLLTTAGSMAPNQASPLKVRGKASLMTADGGSFKMSQSQPALRGASGGRSQHKESPDNPMLKGNIPFELPAKTDSGVTVPRDRPSVVTIGSSSPRKATYGTFTADQPETLTDAALNSTRSMEQNLQPSFHNDVDIKNPEPTSSVEETPLPVDGADSAICKNYNLAARVPKSLKAHWDALYPQLADFKSEMPNQHDFQRQPHVNHINTAEKIVPNMILPENTPSLATKMPKQLQQHFDARHGDLQNGRINERPEDMANQYEIDVFKKNDKPLADRLPAHLKVRFASVYRDDVAKG